MKDVFVKGLGKDREVQEGKKRTFPKKVFAFPLVNNYLFYGSTLRWGVDNN